MKQKAVLALAILGIILVSGCVQGNTPSTPSTGITSKLTISKAPALNENTELTLTVTTIRTAPTASAKITLPEGFELVSGDLNWNGELAENQPLQLKATVKAVKTGNWTIFGGGPGEGDYLYITVNSDSAYLSEKPFPIPERGKKYADTEPTLPLLKECCKICITSVNSGPCSNVQYGRGPSGQDCDDLFNITTHGDDRKIVTVEDCKAIP